LVLLGDQQAPCRDTRAAHCRIPGHPCLATVSPADVVAAISSLGPTALADQAHDPVGGAL
jgi:hypothetical protein